MATVTKSVCRSCRLSHSGTAAARTFATSSSRSAIPPESPNYVDIPDTYQTDFIPRRRPKGILPVPREIFGPQQPDKPSKQYLNRLIPPRTAPTKPPAKMSDQEEYKSRMTDLRRRHLRSGLLELYNRKVTMTAEINAKSTRRQNERARLISQPSREDERLTSTSIPSAMRITPGDSATSTDAAAIHARKLANVQRKESETADSRLDALHTLYMHARTFITTEDQLNAAIVQAFDNPTTEWKTDATPGVNIWNREAPATVAELLQEDTGAGGRGGKGGTDDSSLVSQREKPLKIHTDQERMKRIAEVLSGGTM